MTAISAPDGNKLHANDNTMDNAIIRNNTIHYPSGTNSNSRYGAIFAAAEGVGHIIANNAVHFVSGGTCFVTPLAASACAFVGNNACNGYSSWGTSYDDPGDRITAPPLFMAPPADFTPQTGSPLIGHGSAVYGAEVDIHLRPRLNPPSIGVVEP